MLDLKLVKENLDQVAARLKTRGFELDTAAVKKLEESRRTLIFNAEKLKSEKNALSKQIGALKAKGEDASGVMAKVKALGDDTAAAEKQAGEVDAQLMDLLARVPNIPDEDVPAGTTENENKFMRDWGQAVKFDFKPKTHWEIGEALDILDFDRAVKISGSRFTVYKGNGAALERALIQFMLNVQTRENGYQEMWPPLLLNAATMYGTGQLPKFEEDLFRLRDEGYYLSPTAEVPLTNLHRDEVLEAAQLPIKYSAYTPCFRAEAGSHGKDIKGMVRQHQFNKVEMVKITAPEQSDFEHEEMVKNAEVILQRLGLAYRVVMLCGGEAGFSAAKCYDIEVYVAGMDKWWECSSVSNCRDFQARRAKVKVKTADGKKVFAHTLNGSGLATSRVLPAIIENYQNEDGSITVPEVLRPYMGGLEKIHGI
jgi:seryl-tRNA synthetase